MRRWNGWGDESVTYPVPPHAAQFLEELVGPGRRPRDASFEEILASIPLSRLPPHPLVSAKESDRLRHARGQSLPDWIALRSGRVSSFPDGVAYPEEEEQVLELMKYARETGARLIPYGGGTSVLGHINPEGGAAPVLTLDLSRLCGLKSLEEKSRLATFGAGTSGPDLEGRLRVRGYTLGHFPQSFELSTLGGWVATRSSGQQSLGYGRIERLFAGGKLLSPAGTLLLPPFPASAAGPDLREVVLGSEGRLGILSEISVRVSPLPQMEHFHAVFFPDFDRGRNAVREMVQAGLPLSMIRLSTAAETVTTLALAGHRRAVGLLERFLSFRGVKKEKSMLLFGLTGRPSWVRKARKEVLGLASRHSGVQVGRVFGREWQKNRFRAPYLRNTLWEAGYAVDTLESAADWAKIPHLIGSVEAALRNGLEEMGERVHLFTHLSHLYPQGSSLYTTYLFRLADSPLETLRRWEVLKKAATEAILHHGGTISHHHGVGKDHLPYLPSEKGELGVKAIGALCRIFDPMGIMNPGKLVKIPERGPTRTTSGEL